MKPRHLLAITPLAVLWVRQLRFEKRFAARQRALEAETRRFAEEVNGNLDRHFSEVERVLRNLVSALNGESRRTPGGARR